MRNEYLLPRKALMDNVFALLEEVRNRPNCREEEMRKWVRELDRSKHALVQWGLVDEAGGRLSLTKRGEAVAWSNERERDDLLLQHVVMGYEPYAVVMTQRLKAWSSTLTTDEVLPIWARNLGITLGRAEMSASSATMFGLMERAGLGRYIIGRGGKATRIEFAADAEERVRAAQEIASHPPTSSSKGEAPTVEPDGQSEPPTHAESEQTGAISGEITSAPSSSEGEKAFVSFARNWSGPRPSDDPDGFEVYRRPGLEIKIRPTKENIKRGIRFLKMLELDADSMPEGMDQTMAT